MLAKKKKRRGRSRAVQATRKHRFPVIAVVLVAVGVAVAAGMLLFSKKQTGSEPAAVSASVESTNRNASSAEIKGDFRKLVGRWLRPDGGYIIHIRRVNAGGRMEAAKAELAAVRAKGLKPTRDCQAEADALAHHSQSLNGEAEILQSWQGNYPVAQLKLLPEKQCEQAVGFIDDAKIFEAVWKVFKPGEAVPEIDFKTNLVLFARNTQFYNRISIGKVKVTNGVAEVLAMETMSAMPIEDKVAMSLAVVARQRITAIQAGDKNIPINQKP